ncbi:hypothetical protein UlMin_004231 [Ulmus minor]
MFKLFGFRGVNLVALLDMSTDKLVKLFGALACRRIISVYNGKTFNQVEIKPEMIDPEFSISHKPVKHGRPGIGATHSSRSIPLN